QGGGWGGHRESVGTDKVLLPQPLPLPRLDLSNCSLHDVPPGLAEATTAIVLDLTENPLTTLPSDSFLGFTHLQSLAVPPALECPGGSEAWQDVTLDGSSRLCQGQRNPCNTSVELGTGGDCHLGVTWGCRGVLSLPGPALTPPQGRVWEQDEPH
uniref:ARAID factor n=1 Tax=Zosterops lateralis melanops TaxID=1220523 RepID=A0A8D2P5A4_ZOSLA